MMLRSKRSSTDLISPSSALARPEVHALNQTVDTPGSAAKVASSRCRRLLLPMPQAAGHGRHFEQVFVGAVTDG
jgi:hypothetical protein